MVLVIGLVLIIAAFGSWGVAFGAAMGIMRMVPKSERWKAWFDLGWWRLDRLRKLAGPEVEPLQKRYVLAWTVFFAVIVLGIALSLLLYVESENGKIADIALLNQSVPLLPTGSQEI